MRELSLFTGSGGGLLASRLLGWTTVCAVESSHYMRRILLARQQGGDLGSFPILKDVRTFDPERWRGLVDVISGGFPCQPFSTASRGRKVVTDLWPEMLRIVIGVDPTYVFAENVHKAPIEKAAQDLARHGYMVRCARISGACLGSPHRRPRCWLVATHPDHEGQCAKSVNVQMARVRCTARLGWANPPSRRILGMDDGVANRVVRFRAVGNGQQPSVAAFAWLVLS